MTDREKALEALEDFNGLLSCVELSCYRPLLKDESIETIRAALSRPDSEAAFIENCNYIKEIGRLNAHITKLDARLEAALSSPQPKLQELIDGITPENKHDEVLAKIVVVEVFCPCGNKIKVSNEQGYVA